MRRFVWPLSSEKDIRQSWAVNFANVCNNIKLSSYWKESLTNRNQAYFLLVLRVISDDKAECELCYFVQWNHQNFSPIGQYPWPIGIKRLSYWFSVSFPKRKLMCELCYFVQWNHQNFSPIGQYPWPIGIQHLSFWFSFSLSFRKRKLRCELCYCVL
jgi:hypothetical protein